jgi:hypothetical protein
MWRYRNPVEIAFGSNAFDRLPSLVAGRRYALVTYPDAAFAEAAERLFMAVSSRSASGPWNCEIGHSAWSWKRQGGTQ